MGHGHDHAPVPRNAENRRKLTIVLGLTTTYLAAEVVGGLLTKSLALLADAGHMLTDVAGIALALIAMKFAERPATPERTYGYHRVEILAALINGAVLIGISVYVLFEAYQRIRHPQPIAGKTMLIVAAVGLVVNVVGLIILRKGSEQSLNMRGAYFEVLSDMLTSVGVIIAAGIVIATGWTYADPIVSAGIGLFIFPRTLKLMSEAAGVLLEGTPAEVNLAVLREKMNAVDGVAGVHDLHVWVLTSGVNAMSAHVVRAPGADHDAVLHAVRAAVVGEFKIEHVTLQIEGVGCEAHETHL